MSLTLSGTVFAIWMLYSHQNYKPLIGLVTAVSLNLLFSTVNSGVSEGLANVSEISGFSGSFAKKEYNPYFKKLHVLVGIYSASTILGVTGAGVGLNLAERLMPGDDLNNLTRQIVKTAIHSAGSVTTICGGLTFGYGLIKIPNIILYKYEYIFGEDHLQLLLRLNTLAATVCSLSAWY